MAGISRLTVRGFKSIRTLEDFELRDLNVLIGANGAGKSNFISLFQMLAALMDRQLQLYVQENDGPDSLLFGTRRRTKQVEAEFYTAMDGYRVTLRPAGRQMVFSREETWQLSGLYAETVYSLGSGHNEARLPSSRDSMYTRHIWRSIPGWRVYHFHDTSNIAPMRQAQPLRDNLRLKQDAGNIAPFLRMLRERYPERYRHIVEMVQMVAPFFGDFVHRDEPGERIELEWFQRDDLDTPYGPRQLSDGTLRFICLATLLLQPTDLQPETILIDEPELGLHPYAVVILASMLRQASEERQIIVSTQSVELVNQLGPEDVVVVGRGEGASTFARLDAERLKDWLEDYTLGELWKANVFGGGPAR